jgi:hypothetical protein
MGTRCLSSSTQFKTTTMLAGVALGDELGALSFKIRNRLPSAETSYVRPGAGSPNQRNIEKV